MNTAGAFGEVAHNVAASSDMVRGSLKESEALCNDPENLLLLCPSCHTLIDKKQSEDLATVELLKSWKEQHEKNVSLLAKYKPKELAVGLIATGEIRGRTCKLSSGAFVRAAVSMGYSLIDDPMRIELPSAPVRGGDGRPNWDAQADHIYREIEVFRRLASGIETLIVAGLAEMPSLIYLGYLVGNEYSVVTLQPQRTESEDNLKFTNPGGAPPQFHVQNYSAKTHNENPSVVNVVLAVSASVDLARLGEFCNMAPTVVVTVDEPNRGIVQSQSVNEEFSRTVFALLDKLEAEYGREATLRVFPVVPAPLAIEFGRMLCPKNGMSVTIFDASGPSGAFHESLKISAT